MDRVRPCVGGFFLKSPLGGGNNVDGGKRGGGLNYYFWQQKMISAPLLTPVETKIMVLLPATVKRFDISHLRDFLNLYLYLTDTVILNMLSTSSFVAIYLREDVIFSFKLVKCTAALTIKARKVTLLQTITPGISQSMKLLLGCYFIFGANWYNVFSWCVIYLEAAHQ